MIDLGRIERDPAYAKACCSAFYRSPIARLAFGESLHPGGLALTRELGARLDLPRGSRVLDLGSGGGATVAFLRQAFGWHAFGIEYDARLNGGPRRPLVSADAERLPVRSGSVDGAVSECSLGILPDRAAAAAELFRVVRSGGRVGISDVVLEPSAPLSPAMQGALAAVACVATAQPREVVADLLRRAGFEVLAQDDRPDVLASLVADLRGKVQLARALLDLDSVELLGFRVRDVPDLLDEAEGLVRDGHLSYGLWAARRP